MVGQGSNNDELSNLLNIEGLNVFYGESHIIQGVDLQIKKGEILVMLGRNGMGKTTLLKSIIGILPPKSGSITFKNKYINNKKAHIISRQGIAYVPQGREIFSNLTVEDNLKVGAMQSNGLIPTSIYEYFPILKERLKQKGGTLSGGEQQMLSLGRALASKPDLMLMDEPTEGIQPSIVDEIACIIKAINKDMQLSLLLVEQNVDFALGLADRCCFMEKGKIVCEGAVEDLRDEEIRRYCSV